MVDVGSFSGDHADINREIDMVALKEKATSI
jgi:hypothetical protein